MSAVVIAIAALAIGCSGAGAPESCGDDLAGIWEAGERRYHVAELAGAVEIFALADSRGGLDRPMPGARRSASYARLERSGDRLAGHGQQFRARGDAVCRVRWPIAARCDRGRLELEIAEPGAVDFDDCSQAPTGGERSVALTRIRAL